jgi:hypothetical protein
MYCDTSVMGSGTIEISVISALPKYGFIATLLGNGALSNKGIARIDYEDRNHQNVSQHIRQSIKH